MVRMASQIVPVEGREKNPSEMRVFMQEIQSRYR